MRIVIPVRVMVFVSGEIPPFTTFFVPEALAVESPFTRATCGSRREVSGDGWAQALGWQTSGPGWGRRWGRVLFPCLVVDGLDAVVFRR
jgi:hypothetical protein